MFGKLKKRIYELEIEISKLIKENKYQKRQIFREGDLVYIDHKNFNPITQYYLLESYNGGSCWYVSKNQNDTNRRELVNGVGVENISFEKPKVCHSCGNKIH